MINKKKSKKIERHFFIQQKKSAKLPFKKRKKHKPLVNFKKIYKELNFKQYKLQGGDTIFKNLVSEFQNSELKKVMKGGSQKQKKMNLIINKLERGLQKVKAIYDSLIQALKGNNIQEFRKNSNKLKLQASGMFGNKPIMREVVVNLLKFRKAELKINTSIKRNEFKESKKASSNSSSSTSITTFPTTSSSLPPPPLSPPPSPLPLPSSGTSIIPTSGTVSTSGVIQGGYFQTEDHKRIENIMRAGFLDKIFGEKSKMMDHSGINFSILQPFGIKQNKDIFDFKALFKIDRTLAQTLQDEQTRNRDSLVNELMPKLDVISTNMSSQISDKLDQLVYMSLQKPLDVVRYDLGFLDINPNGGFKNRKYL